MHESASQAASEPTFPLYSSRPLQKGQRERGVHREGPRSYIRRVCPENALHFRPTFVHSAAGAAIPKAFIQSRQAKYMFYSVHTESETRYPGEAQRGTSWSFTGSDQVTSLQCFSRGSQREKMDMKGSFNLTIRLREYLRKLRVDQMSMRTNPEPCRRERTVW